MTGGGGARDGPPLLVGKRPMTRVGRAIEKGETQGFMKVVVDAETKPDPGGRHPGDRRRRGDPRRSRHDECRATYPVLQWAVRAKKRREQSLQLQIKMVQAPQQAFSATYLSFLSSARSLRASADR